MTDNNGTLARLLRRKVKSLTEAIAKSIDKTALLTAELHTLRRAMDEAEISEQEDDDQIVMPFADSNGQPAEGF